MPTVKPVVIMGAGPAGLTAAWELVRSGREVVVWEADPSYVGGLSRTVQAEGYRFDIGGHLFYSASPEVNEFWRKVLPDDFVQMSVVQRMIFQGKSFDLPFNARKDGFKLGFLEGFKGRLGFSGARGKAGAPEENLEQWLINRHGKKRYELLFKSYYEKILGLPAAEISASLAERLFKPPPDGKKTFPYPRHGPGQLWESTANRVLERANGIFLDRKVQTVHWDETGVTHITGTNRAGEFYQQEGSNFLSSLPLAELLLALDPPPPKEVAAAARALRHRELVTVCVIVNRELVFPETTIEIHDATVKVANIHNYKNWSAEMVSDADTTSLGMDYYCFQGDNTWNATDYDLAQLAIREVTQLGLVREAEVKDAFVVRTLKALPLYDLACQYHLEVIKQWISLFANLQPLGRNGLHVFNYQDHSMVTAMLAVRNIQGGEFDCWRVDADAKYPDSSKG
jgi:protoporphyrinogen oxidase